MKVTISGISLFGTKLLDVLQKYNKTDTTYVYSNIKGTFFEKMKSYYHILTSDILFVIYVDTYFMKSVDFALKFNKKVILLWVGTDVLRAVPRIQDNQFNTNYLHKVSHYAVAPWLIEELNSVGVYPQYQGIYFHDTSLKRNLYMTTEFSILTYMREGVEDFYGIDSIIKLANSFPKIKFKIAGISQYQSLPDNIELLGWVNINEEYEKCSALIRFAQHDGQGHTVLEALGYGKVVFFNYPYPFVNYVQNYTVLKDGLEKTYNKFLTNQLTISEKSITYINEEYSEEKLAKQYELLFANEFNNKSRK